MRHRLPSSNIKFNILNHTKSDSLFNYGMRVLTSGCKVGNTRDFMWQRSCTNISYYKSAFQRPNKSPVRYYYTLSFTFNFQDYESCYFSYCYPYTYTDLKGFITQITTDKNTSHHVKREKLCTTLGGNSLEILTITDNKANRMEIKNRKGIILMARIHPGESNSSFIM